MITKKVNKSSELILVSPNVLKLPEASKRVNKNSLESFSPKMSSNRQAIKNILKSIDTSKKKKDILPSVIDQDDRFINRTFGMSLNLPSATEPRIKSNNKNNIKKSKSKLMKSDHLSTNILKRSMNQSLNLKQPQQKTHRKHNLSLKWKHEDLRLDRSIQKYKQKLSTKQTFKEKGISKKETIKTNNDEQNKYKELMKKTQTILEKYNNIISGLNQQVKDLKQQNSFLRKKLKIVVD